MKTMTTEQQVADLKRRLILAQNRISYWKRRAKSPTYEADRKKQWRRENPAKADLAATVNHDHRDRFTS